MVKFWQTLAVVARNLGDDLNLAIIETNEFRVANDVVRMQVVLGV